MNNQKNKSLTFDQLLDFSSYVFENCKDGRIYDFFNPIIHSIGETKESIVKFFMYRRSIDAYITLELLEVVESQTKENVDIVQIFDSTPFKAVITELLDAREEAQSMNFQRKPEFISKYLGERVVINRSFIKRIEAQQNGEPSRLVTNNELSGKMNDNLRTHNETIVFQLCKPIILELYGIDTFYEKFDRPTPNVSTSELKKYIDIPQRLNFEYLGFDGSSFALINNDSQFFEMCAIDMRQPDNNIVIRSPNNNEVFRFAPGMIGEGGLRPENTDRKSLDAYLSDPVFVRQINEIMADIYSFFGYRFYQYGKDLDSTILFSLSFFPDRKK